MTEAIMKTQQKPWWLILMGGIVNIIIGVLLLAAPAKTVFVLAIALGIYWIVSGIFTLVAMFIDRSSWGWKLLIGILSILAGFVILSYPIMSALVLPSILILILGINGLIIGILMLIMAFQGGGWGIGILGILSIIFGIILILNFTSPAMVVGLVWAAGFLAIFGGIGELFQAFRQKAS
jgi:uncharacterized membrane protein HdeD (DUF308 family)